MMRLPAFFTVIGMLIGSQRLILPSNSFSPPFSGKSTNVVLHSVRTDDGCIDRRCAVVGAFGLFAASASALVLPDMASAVSGGKSEIEIPTWTLDGGVEFPILALNTVGLSVEDSERAVGLAIAEGIRHVDFHPGKERDGVAAYMAKNGRNSLFLNTKIRKSPPGTSPLYAAERTRAQIDEDLKALGVDQVDMLMLRDSPNPAVIQAQWAVLEDALAKGKTRSIGVINFCQGALQAVLETAKIKPAINYYMLHVGMGTDAHGLRTFGESRGIRTFAYGACGEPTPNQAILSSPILLRIAKEHNKLPEQVALRWVLQSGAGVSVRPTTDFGLGTSTCGEGTKCQSGIKSRASAFAFQLTTKEMTELSDMTTPDDNPTLFSSAGCPGAFTMPK